ncbi:hypothetical protein FACS1894103_2890 [Campylobacterota bacterium]|nr:hypothetical protein FACS1894103_2890 [Campylobacterota bacterium]
MIIRNLLIICAAIAFLAGCGESKAPLQSQKSSFELRSLSGENFAVRIEPSEERYNYLMIDDFGGKPVLFSFFSTTCPECKKKFPHLIDMQNRYKDKIALVGVLLENKSVEEISDFVAFHQLNYPVVTGAGAFRLADAVGGVRLLPTMHIYDGSGRYVAHFVGAVPQEMLETRLNAAMQ